MVQERFHMRMPVQKLPNFALSREQNTCKCIMYQFLRAVGMVLSLLLEHIHFVRDVVFTFCTPQIQIPTQ